MIDERVFGMPHLARGYVEYLVSHETCHQWWYNLVGTNGYAEPFMDEGAADVLHAPAARPEARQEQRDAGVAERAGVAAEHQPRQLPLRRHVRRHPQRRDAPAPRRTCRSTGTSFSLFTGAYDRGSKVFGMIEDRLGEAAFLDFIRGIVAKYSLARPRRRGLPRANWKSTPAATGASSSTAGCTARG